MPISWTLNYELQDKNWKHVKFKRSRLEFMVKCRSVSDLLKIESVERKSAKGLIKEIIMTCK